jgi:ketosteroid isomerase-like protein
LLTERGADPARGDEMVPFGAKALVAILLAVDQHDPWSGNSTSCSGGKALMKTPIAGLDDFAALDPFFRIIEEGLDGLAGPGHFFDLLAEAAVFEYVITVPGYPRRVEGRAAVAELYRPYGDALVLDRCYDLAVHHDSAQGTVVLEYASAGKVVSTGAPYGNRYISVLTLRNREVVHWRDYLDPIAVFDALGWPPRLNS